MENFECIGNIEGTIQQGKGGGYGSLIQINARSKMEANVMYDFETTEMNEHIHFDFKQYTNFYRETVEFNYNDDDCVKFGNTIKINIDNLTWVDFIGDMFLQICLPNVSNFDKKWINDIGHAMIDHIRLINGDEEIFSIHGEFLHLLHHYETPMSKINGVHKMINHYNTAWSFNGNKALLFIDIPFMKRLKERQFFPLFAARNDTFQMEIKFRPLSQLLYVSETRDIKCVFKFDNFTKNFNICLNLLDETTELPDKFNVKLLVDCFKLSFDEISLFKTQDSSFIFHQTQQKIVSMENGTTQKKIQLDFSGFVTEIIMIVVPKNNLENNRFFDYIKVDRITLVIDGHIIHDNKDLNGEYYRIRGPHANIPNKYIYVIPFNLSSLFIQPTGCINLKNSRKNSITVHIDNNTTENEIHLYAVNYNFIEIENAKSRLKYL
jgi:hypothetical protein